MFHRLSSSLPKVWITTLAVVGSCCGSAFGQNFSVGVADADPLGLGALVPPLEDFDLGLTGSIKGDFDYGVGLRGTYNSNLNLSDTNENSDFSAVLTPRIRYDSDPEGGASYWITASYRPSLVYFVDNTNLNKFNNNGDIVFNARGAKTSLAVFGRYSEVSTSDRITGDFIEGSLLTAGLRINRQVAPRTNVFGGLTGAQSYYSTSVDQGATVYTGYLGGLWRATEYLRVGSSMRYSKSTSDLSGDRDAWALLAEARYLLGDRTAVNFTLGPEFSRVDGSAGGTTVRVSADISATYAINARWAWTNSLRTDTIPSPNQTSTQVTDIGFRSSLQRQLVQGMASGGLEYRYSIYDDTGVGAVPRDNESTTSLFAAYRRPLGSERVAFNGVVRYSVNDGLVDWQQFAISLGFDVRF